MNKFKRLTEEYQNELSEIFSPNNSTKTPRSRLKLTVEPFSIERPFFDPSKHDFTATAHRDGEKIGTMAITHRDGGITPYQFYVEKEHRRSGIGTALANKATDWAKKPIIPNLNMNSDAVAWFKKYHEKDIKKSIFEEETLIKSDNYAKKASTGVILLHPISINGKTHQSNGIPMHMTVKSFGDNTQIDPKEVQQHLEKFSIPNLVNEKNMLFMPHTLPAPNGGIHHVLLVYGAPHHIDQIRKGSEKYGQYIHNFLPHISIDKEDWDKFAKMGPILTSDKVGIKIHPAELKSGPQVVKRY